MATGFIALLDDIAALAKLAASSLDDVAAQATKAGSKAAGIVIDDAAVTPRYVVGFASSRELPIIRAIALKSLRNKLVYLLPICLVLSEYLPWLMTPLLMAGGVFLCLEGFHKAADAWNATRGHAKPAEALAVSEQDRVANAVRTDFILSAEIMAIALVGIEGGGSLAMRAAVLTAVGLGMTVLVYGAVALIVKADDAGAALAQSSSGAARAVGTALVRGMPPFLRALSFIGMLAMLWVGGGILIHGLHEVAHVGPDVWIKSTGRSAATLLPAIGGAAAWLVEALLYGIGGLAVGAVADRVVRLFGKH